MKFSKVLAATAIAVGLGRASANAECLSYNGRVTVSGKLTRQTFPGRPNFESVARGDEPETYFVLRLDHAACVRANPADDQSVFVPSIRDMQLMLNGTQFPQLRPLLGKHVHLSGSLEPAVTGHHHTAVMLSEVVTID